MSSDREPEDLENKIFFGKYRPEKKIGEGSFGKIYLALNVLTNEKFALKMENRNTGQSLLESEAFVLCYLKGPGVPSIKSYGFSGDYNILIMELLSKSLEDHFQECGGKFSLKTTCMLADQMISRIEYVHSKHILHRDIKPDNFIMGFGENSHKLYIIDFGLAKKYRSSKTLQHVVFRNNKKLTGTARYASINALKGYEQSRRDDLEAIGYVIMYFIRGILPWQGLKMDRRDDRYKKIYEKKKSTTPEELCQGYPSEFCTYVSYARNLPFEQEPDYEYLRGLFRKILNDHNLSYDYEYDWKKSSKKGMNDKSRNSDNQGGDYLEKYHKNVMTTNISNIQIVGTENNIGNILQTQNNIMMKNTLDTTNQKVTITQENQITNNEVKNLNLTNLANNSQTIENFHKQNTKLNITGHNSFLAAGINAGKVNGNNQKKDKNNRKTNENKKDGKCLII